MSAPTSMPSPLAMPTRRTRLTVTRKSQAAPPPLIHRPFAADGVRVDPLPRCRINPGDQVKVSFPDVETARDAGRRLNESAAVREATRRVRGVYRCPACAGVHLTGWAPSSELPALLPLEPDQDRREAS